MLEDFDPDEYKCEGEVVDDNDHQVSSDESVVIESELEVILNF